MRKRSSDRGQAFTETLLCTGILLAFIAAIYQLYLVNHSIFSAVTAVHQRIFLEGFNANCFDQVDACTYDTESNAKVIWNAVNVPEIRVPIIGMFRSAGLGDVRLISRVWDVEPGKGCPKPCKRSEMGAGTYMDPEKVLLWVAE
jgi:hypothetical protein